ncbi:hypothetical protein G6F60_008072 [Rhizopus arrhizus]|nr:hypothetical protein G6F60_008072 [Rhizopus arrhizus]
MSDSDSPLELCYRCRKGPPETKKTLYECQYCPLMWHETCLSPPFNLVFEKNWMCPQHHEHLLSSRNRRSSAEIQLNNEIMMFETADEIMKYGGVVYSVSAKAIEDEFLRYTRRFRRYSSKSAFYVNKENTPPENECDESSSEYIETEVDGIQMLLDAAAETENYPSEEEDPEHRKYKAIEELVNLVGEDALLEMLSR